jgi:hypothetical protein
MSANVALSDTFDQWRVKTNELIVMTQVDGSDNFISLTDTTNSTSNTTGSIITTGGIGISKSMVIGENLNVHGNIHANGAITADGSITFGSDSADNVVFNADINSNIIPNTNGAYDVGNSTQYWSNGFFESIKLTAASDLGMTALEIDANDADQAAFTIDGEQTTTAVMRIDADVLTTNSVAVFSDNSANNSSRDTVQILQDNADAIAATALYVQSDGGITGMQIDKNYTDVSAATVTGLHVDFDRTVPGSGTAAFTDIGINLDVNAAGLGTTTTTGMDIDVVGATSGTHTAIGLDVTVGSADTNIAARFTGGEVALLTTTKLSFHDVAGGENIVASADGHLEINAGTTLDITAPTVDINVATTLNVDGVVQLTGAVTVGVDDTGHDVKFFGATSGSYLEWDESVDDLILGGAARAVVPEGQLVLGSTAITATATELNQLDGVVARTAGKESIWVPSNAMIPTETNGCAAVTAVQTTSGRPDMYVLDFDADTDEFAQFAIAFPNSWDLGTITFKCFWSGIAATTGVSWALEAVAMNDNETIDVVYGTAVVVDDAAQGAVEELLVTAESSAVTIAGTPADDDLTYFRVYRDVSDSNDTMNGDARLHGCKIFFTTNAANDA